MDDSTPQSRGVPGDRVVWVVWSSLVASIFIYGVALWFISGVSEVELGRLRVLTIAFGLAAVGEIGVSVWLRRALFFGRLESGDFESLEEVRQHYFMVNIISWALAESIAIYGFILSMFGAGFTAFLAFALVAVALDVAFRPDPDGVREVFESSHPTDDTGSSGSDEREARADSW